MQSGARMCAICRWIEDWDYNKMKLCNRGQERSLFLTSPWGHISNLWMLFESLNVPLKELDPTNFSTFDEHLQYLKEKRNHRVCLRKSGLQGGKKIIEYCGEQIRCSVSDAREARYRVENKDCYFFRISDEFILDATRKGNVARLTNHSCQPNCYARIVTSHETNRIVFVAKEAFLLVRS